MSNNKREGQARIQLSGLWKQQNQSGKVYYAGDLGPGAQLQLWPNKFKEEGDKRPDLILYLVKRGPKKKGDEREEKPSDEVPF